MIKTYFFNGPDYQKPSNIILVHLFIIMYRYRILRFFRRPVQDFGFTGYLISFALSLNTHRNDCLISNQFQTVVREDSGLQ